MPESDHCLGTWFLGDYAMDGIHRFIGWYRENSMNRSTLFQVNEYTVTVSTLYVYIRIRIYIYV